MNFIKGVSHCVFFFPNNSILLQRKVEVHVITYNFKLLWNALWDSIWMRCAFYNITELFATMWIWPTRLCKYMVPKLISYFNILNTTYIYTLYYSCHDSLLTRKKIDNTSFVLPNDFSWVSAIFMRITLTCLCRWYHTYTTTTNSSQHSSRDVVHMLGWWL